MLMLGLRLRQSKLGSQGSARPLGQDCRAEPLQRGFEVGISDLRDASSQMSGLLGRERPARRRSAWVPLRYRSLNQRESRHGAIAEKSIDALEYLWLAVLHRESRCGTDPKLEHAILAAAGGKAQFHRQRFTRELVAHHGVPFRHELRFAEAALAEGSACNARQLTPHRAHPATPSLAVA